MLTDAMNRNQKHLIHFISIIGLSDGLTVPFALTAGLSSIGSSRIVVLGGVAELIAGAISMGIGGFCELNHSLSRFLSYSD